MENLSLGIIETIGLAAAVEAADVCLKSANVVLVGYEFTKGDGMVLVKIQGNVGAVKAAVDAARMAAGKVNRVVSAHVIPRPGPQTGLLIRTAETVGMIPSQEPEQEPESEAESYTETIDVPEAVLTDPDVLASKAAREESAGEASVQTEAESVQTEEVSVQTEEVSVQTEENIEQEEKETDFHETVEKGAYTCNICRDPQCTRRKGDLRSQCIHYK